LCAVYRQGSHASSKSAQRVEIHAHRHNNGMMSMEQVDAITVPAGGEFVFAPGDHHIMLIGLIKPISEGDQVDLSLSADNGEVIKLLLPVRSVLNEH
jgi:copper(I)-binding protein